MEMHPQPPGPGYYFPEHTLLFSLRQVNRLARSTALTLNRISQVRVMTRADGDFFSVSAGVRRASMKQSIANQEAAGLSAVALAGC